MGASTLWAGPWKRIFSYGDMQAEYEAVRHRVGVIDVGTLGKFLLAGPDVVEFLAWASEPHLEARNRTGVRAVCADCHVPSAIPSAAAG